MTPKQKAMIRWYSNQNKNNTEISRITGIPRTTIRDFKVRDFNRKLPKILLWDIETAPNIAYHWGRWKVNVSEGHVIQQSYLLTWSAKWLGEEEVFSDSVHLHHKPAELGKPCDREIIESLWTLLDQADIIIHQNGDRFDLPEFNNRLVYYGLKPIHPSKQVDTLKIAKYNFRFPSNSLDSIAAYLGLSERKLKTDFSLWRRCMEGDITAFEEMVEYNKQDVVLLEEVYKKLRPFDNKHPNLGLFVEEDVPVCGTCGSPNIDRTDRHAMTPVSKFVTYRCNDCGSVKRGRSNIATSRENILSNIAR